MITRQLKSADLQGLGFEFAASWVVTGETVGYRFLEESEARMNAVFSVSNALYAFCSGPEVLYIGKTTQSLRKRLQGYCRPGSTQRTNKKCHNKIREALAKGEEIRIFAFGPPTDLQFRGFEINLAGGLEDILIRKIDPPWNGTDNGATISESAELEAAQLETDVRGLKVPSFGPETGSFTMQLHPTYYNRGIVNPGVKVSHLFGATDEKLTIHFSDGLPSMATRIDRHANRSGAVRFVGSNQTLANWFQRHFEPGDTVTIRILGPYEAEFLV